MVAMEFAASCRPLRKSKASATKIRKIRIWIERVASTNGPPLSQMIDNECVDLVRHVLEAIDHRLQMVVDLGADDEIHGAAGLPAAVLVGHVERLAALIVKLVGLLLDPDHPFSERIELSRVGADRAQEWHGLQHQF